MLVILLAGSVGAVLAFAAIWMPTLTLLAAGALCVIAGAVVAAQPGFLVSGIQLGLAGCSSLA